MAGPAAGTMTTTAAATGTTIPAGYTVKADENGSIGYAGLYYVTEPGFPLGLWRFEGKDY